MGFSEHPKDHSQKRLLHHQTNQTLLHHTGTVHIHRKLPSPEKPFVYCPALHPFQCQQSDQSRCLLRKLLTRLVQASCMVDTSAAVSGHLH